MEMLVSTLDGVAGEVTTSRKTVAVLDELLVHSIRLRDAYKNARWQTSGIQFQHLHLLFDSHYKGQLRLVDVLMDRIRMLDGADRVFAGDFLQRTRFSDALHGRKAPIRLLRDLLDAHELVLSAARPTERNDVQNDLSWVRDLAVGQVVLTNELQSWSVNEQLVSHEPKPRVSPK
jgi:starvation-inducible DNA-binding protein